MRFAGGPPAIKLCNIMCRDKKQPKFDDIEAETMDLDHDSGAASAAKWVQGAVGASAAPSLSSSMVSSTAYSPMPPAVAIALPSRQRPSVLSTAYTHLGAHVHQLHCGPWLHAPLHSPILFPCVILLQEISISGATTAASRFETALVIIT